MKFNPDDVFIDHESFSEINLKKSGTYRYAEDKSTEIMLTTYAFGNEEVQCYDATDGSRLPSDLRDVLRFLHRNPGKKGNPKLIGANYLMFDRLLLRNCWGYEIDPRDIIDTKVTSFRHALPGSLEAQCEALQITGDMAKDKRGKALIQRFCKPTPKNYKIRRYSRDTHPTEWEEFIQYAISDVIADREVFCETPDWGNTAFEDAVLAIDQRINDRGFFVDTALANAAIKAVKEHKEVLKAEALKEFGGKLTGNDFLPMVRELAPDFEFPNAQKVTLESALEDEDLPDDARALIEMRLGASSTASTKYNPLVIGISADGRRRGCLQYGGASRTLRWSGKDFQPQNLARGWFSDHDNNGNYTGELTNGINYLLKGRAHWLYDVSKLTASTVRGCIIPEPGKKLVVADYSNVEGRGLAWLAGEETVLDTFRAGTDLYKVLASSMFKVRYEDVTKGQRQIAKAAVLGLGFGGGVAAFLQFARNLGLDLVKLAEDMDGSFPDHIWNAARKGFEFARIQEKNKRGLKGKKPDRPSYDLPKKVWLTCDSIKRMYREANPNIARFWSDLENAVKKAIANPGEEFGAGANVRADGSQAIKVFRGEKDSCDFWWLTLELPSGRKLSYPGIGVSMEKQVLEDEDNADSKVVLRERIRFMGVNPITKKWGKRFTYGGSLVENVTQALCRDLLAAALVRVEEAGWPVVLHVHDELVCETPDTADYTAKMLEDLMCELPVWAKGFPLAAEGQELFRYAK